MNLTPNTLPTSPFRRGSAASLYESSPTRPQLRPQQHDRRGSTSSPAVPIPKESLSPADGYDYGDVGRSPEGSATTERENLEIKANGLELRLDGQATTHGAAQSGLEKAVEEVQTKLYERQAGNRRAKIPDGDSDGPVTNGTVCQSGDTEAQPSFSAEQPRPSLWKRLRERSRKLEVVDNKGHTKLRHVMLHWGKGDVDGAQRLIINANLPSVADQRSDSQNHVVWQHSELEDMSFDKLQEIVTRSKSQGLRESEIGLTRRLLKRVRGTAEKDFVGGRFLTPLTLRYDMLDDSRYNVDKCCIFLSFPYFDVHTAGAEKPYRKGDVEHPTRTLLQSRYRLNKTAERDKTQCIRRLKGKALKSCIDAQKPECNETMPKVTEDLIHVPQLWALIMGVDRMITAGHINDEALQGSSIKINDSEAAGQAKTCSLIRISFRNQGKLEELTYPIEQCASWFGLLNKHQQIRETLKKDGEKRSEVDPKAYDPHDYKLQIKGRVVDGLTWASVQRSAEGEVLNLWMKTPKRKGPKVSVSMHGNSDSAVTDDDSRLDEEETSESNAATNFPALDPIPVVSAFLEWQILDEFGEADNCPLAERLNCFLSAIYRSLSVSCASQGVELGVKNAKQHRSNLGPKASARPKVSVEGKSIYEVENLIFQLAARQHGHHTTVEQKLFWTFRKVFRMFIPATHDQDCVAIKLFWGALYEILNHHSYLEPFLKMANSISAEAEQIHLGVYYQKFIADKEAKDAISDSAVLLSSTVDALGAVLNMLVEAVRDVRLGQPEPNVQRSSCGKKVSRNCSEACRLLKQAKNELISEATGAASGENIGPVLTPEAILIALMGRLVRGVYHNRSVDVINIFEECLEHLALKVKDRASRSLLQMVNAFEEEVSIVYDVLLQQKKVLLELRMYLDPASFKNPSIARKLRFDFERKGIERTLLSIREQLDYCVELSDRAKILATQNVQLVETLQDDNGRVIFIFTFITVLFLPLTFVAGFFGMNLAGISGTSQTTSHFWYIALPVTAAIMVFCAVVMFGGEEFWFALALLPQNTLKKLKRNKKKKQA